MGVDCVLCDNESDCWADQLLVLLSNHRYTVRPRRCPLDLADRFSLGAGIAALFYTLFPDNPIVLPILGWLFSIPCFYVITQMPDYGQASRFTLLAYVSYESLLVTIKADM